MNFELKQRTAAVLFACISYAWVIVIALCAERLFAQATRSVGGSTATSMRDLAFFPPRVERDAARDRIWTIDDGVVRLYDARSRTRLKTITLPGWSSVSEQHSCPADLVVDMAGNLIASSNIMPTLWRGNAQSLALERIDITLDADIDKDVGFTGLLSTSRDRLYAISAIHGSLWRIDLNARRATKLRMAAPLKGACALGLAIQVDVGQSRFHQRLMPPLHLCASTAAGSRRIEVTGLAQATVTNESCLLK